MIFISFQDAIFFSKLYIFGKVECSFDKHAEKFPSNSQKISAQKPKRFEGDRFYLETFFKVLRSKNKFLKSVTLVEKKISFDNSFGFFCQLPVQFRSISEKPKKIVAKNTIFVKLFIATHEKQFRRIC